MTLKQKLEQSINSLYNEIKKLELNKDDINFINLQGFLYSIGRLNALQLVATLTMIAIQKNMTINEIEERLEGEF